MIARVWRGVVRSEDADVYGRYIDETGSRPTRRRPATGAPGCCAATRAGAPSSSPSRSGTPSRPSRRSPARSEAAVYYPEDERYLIKGEDGVKHYEVER